MATQTKTTEIPAADRIKELNDGVVEAQRKLVGLYLDTTERTLGNIADVQERIAAATRFEPVAEIGKLQAKLTRELTGAYVAAGRDLIA